MRAVDLQLAAGRLLVYHCGLGLDDDNVFESVVCNFVQIVIVCDLFCHYCGGVYLCLYIIIYLYIYICCLKLTSSCCDVLQQDL